MLNFIKIQTLEHVAEQSETMAYSDPHGWKVTVISLTVVILSLFILYLCYTIIGLIVNKSHRRSEEKNEQRELNHSAEYGVHDIESYKITLSRKPKDTTHADYSSICRIESETAVTDGNESNKRQQTSKGKAGVITSPLPGLLTRLNVKIGDSVIEGQTVAKLEAMKMDNSIEAESNGTVIEIYVSQGDTLLEGTPIMKIQ
jgi:biotin carboxyl carrier protein